MWFFHTFGRRLGKKMFIHSTLIVFDSYAMPVALHIYRNFQRSEWKYLDDAFWIRYWKQLVAIGVSNTTNIQNINWQNSCQEEQRNDRDFRLELPFCRLFSSYKDFCRYRAWAWTVARKMAASVALQRWQESDTASHIKLNLNYFCHRTILLSDISPNC